MLAIQGLAHSEGCMGQAGGDRVNDSSATILCSVITTVYPPCYLHA